MPYEMHGSEKRPLLVYGYGNPGRSDDGLGIALAEAVERKAYPHIHVETNYQLHPEDALLISEYTVVLFADASKTCRHGFTMYTVGQSCAVSFTTHAMDPASIVGLSRSLYGWEHEAYMLAIEGYEWDLGETLSTRAEKNLEQALDFLHPLLMKPEKELFDQAGYKIKQRNVS